jgi:phenylacetate-CoA ligase
MAHQPAQLAGEHQGFDGAVDARSSFICDFEPDVIMLTPSYMLTLLDEFARQGIDPTSTSLKVGIFGAEPWTEQMRSEIEQRMDIHAVDIYGLSEVMGPGVSQECVEPKTGYPSGRTTSSPR